MSRTLTITTGSGRHYAGHIATITSTMLGREDHGTPTFEITLTSEGSTSSLGGYRLGAHGIDMLMTILEVTGAPTWEELQDRQVIALYDETDTSLVGLAHLTDENRIFILSEIAAETNV